MSEAAGGKRERRDAHSGKTRERKTGNRSSHQPTAPSIHLFKCAVISLKVQCVEFSDIHNHVFNSV